MLFLLSQPEPSLNDGFSLFPGACEQPCLPVAGLPGSQMSTEPMDLPRNRNPGCMLPSSGTDVQVAPIPLSHSVPSDPFILNQALCRRVLHKSTVLVGLTDPAAYT